MWLFLGKSSHQRSRGRWSAVPQTYPTRRIQTLISSMKRTRRGTTPPCNGPVTVLQCLNFCVFILLCSVYRPSTEGYTYFWWLVYYSGRGTSAGFTEFSVLPKSKEFVGLISDFWRRKLWQVKEMFGIIDHAGGLHNPDSIQAQICKGCML